MSTSDNPDSLRFSLAHVPLPERREVVREVAGRAIANLDLIPKTDDPQMEVEIRLLPGIVITDACVSPHWASSYDHSRGDDDFTLLWSSVPAKGWVRQFDRESLADGSAVLLSAADRMTFETDESFPHVSVKLQRAALCSLLPHAEAAFGQPISKDNLPLRLLKAYLADYRAIHDAGSTPELQHSVAVHITDLVALAFGTHRDATERASARGLRAAQRSAVKRWIRMHLLSPALSVSAAAAAVKLNPRSVQRLFEEEGTTFTRYVLRERLALAHRRLTLPALAGRSITQIAYDCGFGDLSHFTNSFRKIYGQTPSEVRRIALAAMATLSF
jgi:AraC-like DNA-binding protein